ncbi:MAG: amidohydrolase [Pseudonocardiales bacterium]|nr:amidohydrolase [Pseudonocardiales bacterium]
MSASTTVHAICNVTLIDGSGSAPQAGQAMLVDGARIAWVGPETELALTEQMIMIDGHGGTVLPGLINCHVHLCNDGAPDLFAQVRADSSATAALRGHLNLQLTLQAGITTVRDCGAANNVAIELAKAVEDGLIAGPRIRAAGRVITMTGGHGHFIGREADGPDGVRAATRAEIKEGAHFIKAMATGGVLTPGVTPTQTALQFDELEMLAREAHNAGRRATCHAIGNTGIKNAVRAGIDGIEHGFYLDDEALELMIDRQTFLVPTLLAGHQIIANGRTGRVPAWIAAKSAEGSEHHRESFVAAVKSGLRIAAGTDAGTPFNPHGDLATELALMVEYGLGPMAAIVAATSGAATNLDLDHDTGRLVPGHRADVIIVDGDPSQEIDALSRVRFVMSNGVVARDDLDSRLPVGGKLLAYTPL